MPSVVFQRLLYVLFYKILLYLKILTLTINTYKETNSEEE
jgi:hypothetical protein